MRAFYFGLRQESGVLRPALSNIKSEGKRIDNFTSN
jgi:hypothetical protein